MAAAIGVSATTSVTFPLVFNSVFSITATKYADTTYDRNIYAIRIKTKETTNSGFKMFANSDGGIYWVALGQ